MPAPAADIRDPMPFRLAKRLSITPESADALARRVVAWARRHSADGYFPDDLGELAWCVQFEGDCAALVAALVAEGVAEETERGPRMAGWAADVERRAKGAERVRRHREKSVTGAVTPHVTEAVTPVVTEAETPVVTEAETVDVTRPVTPPVTPESGALTRAAHSSSSSSSSPSQAAIANRDAARRLAQSLRRQLEGSIHAPRNLVRRIEADLLAGRVTAEELLAAAEKAMEFGGKSYSYLVTTIEEERGSVGPGDNVIPLFPAAGGPI